MAKFLIAPPSQKVAKKPETLTARKLIPAEPRIGVNRLQGSTASNPLTDRFPKVLPKEEGQKVRKGYNLLSQRRAVHPSRLQYVQERHQQLMAEVELRRQNAKPFVTRQALHSGRLDKIK